MTIETPIAAIAEAETVPLEELGDVPIDDVLSVMDAEVPLYRDLYYRWERQQWSVGSLDLSEDRRQWVEDIDDELKRSLLWGLSSFYVGEQQVTETLVPFVDAAPTEEQQVFLATQLADEARHTIFFDRFYSEVLGEDGEDMGGRLAAQSRRLNPGFRTLLLEMLPAASERIRTAQGSAVAEALVEGVVLYHIVIEATLALTGQRFILNFTRDAGLLPGFRQGFTAVARDESRHVGFGVRFLREMIESEPLYADVASRYLDSVLPVTLSVIDPPGGDMSYFEPLPYGPDELTAFALNSLTKRMRAIGLNQSSA